VNLPPFERLHVRTESGGYILVVELDHGRVNEMGKIEIDEWAELARFLHQNDVRAVITTSHKQTRKGTPIFIAGANVTERADWTDDAVRAHVRRQRETLHALRGAPAFHIVIVNGLALGWGTEFLITADYRIATGAASFALPETSIGILPGAGGTSDLPHIIGVNQALRMGMTGERLDADEALRIRLVDEVATDAEAGMDRAMALADMVSRRSPTAVATYKSAVLAGQELDRAAARDLEGRAYEHCLDSGDAAIGRADFKRITAGESVDWNPRKPFGD
jgi:enoyl-CoA hydratase/carnithine racemase